MNIGLSTPEIIKKESIEDERPSSGKSIASSTSSEPVKTNRILKFSEILDSDEHTLKIPALQDSRTSTPIKSI